MENNANQKKFIIELKQDGSFNDPHTRIYTLNSGDALTLSLDSTKIKNFRPILLSNYPKKNKKGQLHFPLSQPVTTSPARLSQEQIVKYYTCFSGTFNKEGSWEVEIKLNNEVFGSLYLQIVFVDVATDLSKGFQSLDVRSFGRPEWILVQPTITLNKDKLKDFSQLNLLSVLPYCLGKSEEWVEKLQNQTNLGYNAIHFSPIQELGVSRLTNCIQDQLKLNPDLFNNCFDYQEIEQIVKTLESNQGAISFIDVIVEYTSQFSKWLSEVPSALYNQKTTPQLSSAIALDESLAELSTLFEKKLLSQYHKGNVIECMDDVVKVMDIIKVEVFEKLKLKEFFLINVEETENAFRKQLQSQKIHLPEYESQLESSDNFFGQTGFQILGAITRKHTSNWGAKRFGVEVNVEAVIQEIHKDYKKFSLEAFDSELERINEIWEQKTLMFENEIMNNLKIQLVQKLNLQKRITITEQNTLFDRYFIRLPQVGKEYAALNGYVKDSSAAAVEEENIAESQNYYYLRRNVEIQNFQVKLRYGKSKKDNPILWKRMKNYVQKMAAIFHGFFLERGIGSLGLGVGEYFIRKARQVNSRLLIAANLSFNNDEHEAIFAKRWGINCLVKDEIGFMDSYNLNNSLYQHSQTSDYIIGSLPPYTIEGEKNVVYQTLVPKIPQFLVFDQFKTGPAVIQCHGVRQMLSFLALNSFSRFSRGSVKGFDDLFHGNLNEFCKDLYKKEIDTQQQCFWKHQLRVGFIYRPTDEEKNWENLQVELCGSWNNWQKQTMVKIPYGDMVFQFFVDFEHVGTYEYKFCVGGFWKNSYNKKTNEHFNHFFELNDSHKPKFLFRNYNLVRRSFNQLSQKLALKYSNIYVKHCGFNTIAIERENAQKNKSYVLINRSSYLESINNEVNFQVELPGIMKAVKFIYFASAGLQDGGYQPGFIGNLVGQIYQDFNIREYADIFVDEAQGKTVLHFYNMPPSLTIVIKCKTDEAKIQSMNELNNIYNQIKNKDAFNFFSQYTAQDINYIFYSCQEEQTESKGISLYQFPNSQRHLNYAGFASVFADVAEACQQNDTNKPFCQNIRQGFWYLDYILSYLKKRQQINQFTKLFETIMYQIKNIPKVHTPYYFCQFVQLIQEKLTKYILANTAKSLKSQALYPIQQSLHFAVYQFFNDLPSNNQYFNSAMFSSGLPHYCHKHVRLQPRVLLASFKSMYLISGLHQEAKAALLFLAAYFRHGLLPSSFDKNLEPRYNNRDVCWWFIKAVKDYCEFVQNYDLLNEEVELKYFDDNYEIYQMQVNKQKVNLLVLDESLEIQSLKLGEDIKKYNELTSPLRQKGKAPKQLEPTKEEKQIQKQKSEETQLKIKEKQDQLNQKKEEILKKMEQGVVKKLKVVDIVQCIFQRHAEGIKFREWEAGKALDANLQTEGFNIDLKLDEETGFILGGNQHNALTWMNVIGSNEKTSNKGIPATSRNGAPVETVALLKHCLEFAIKANEKKLYPFDSVNTASGKKLTFKDWSDRIKKSFEKNFWITGENNKDAQADEFCTFKEFYKDVVSCKTPESEYQLRPNACIAIALAPELFDPKNALKYLQLVEQYLLSKQGLGIKTINSSNSHYVQDYDGPEDDTSFFQKANGFNLHNGPEWVFLFGYFLQSLHNIKIQDAANYKIQEIFSYLAHHKEYLTKTNWLSLPEFTNAGGQFCKFACSACPWSISTILELVFYILKGN